MANASKHAIGTLEVTVKEHSRNAYDSAAACDAGVQTYCHLTWCAANDFDQLRPIFPGIEKPRTLLGLLRAHSSPGAAGTRTAVLPARPLRLPFLAKLTPIVRGAKVDPMSDAAPVTLRWSDVPSPTTDVVRRKLDAGQSCVVRGASGTGKSHAVRAAVNGVTWVDVAPAPFTVPAFLTSLTRQLDPMVGRSALAECARGDTESALARVGEALGSRTLVVDGGEHAAYRPSTGFDEPVEAMHAAEAVLLRMWLARRVREFPTVVITSRRLSELELPPDLHQSPKDWTIKLTRSTRGFYEWRQAAGLVESRPGPLLVAAAAATLLGAQSFNAIVEDLQWGEASVGTAVRAFADAAVSSMSATSRTVIAIHQVIEYSPASLRGLVVPSSPEFRTATRVLEDLHLIDTHRGVVHVSAAIAAAVGRAEVARESIDPHLRQAATRLADSVNDPESLEPEDAASVLLAHRLFVHLDDFDAARRTARLHAAGLIELARRVSLEERWDEARRLYERIREVLPEPTSTSETTQRMYSYVEHYRGYNGARAGTLPNGEVLRSYETAIRFWRENALWAKRQLCLLIRLGRFAEFWQALRRAEADVPGHERKDTYLKVLPAGVALRAGAMILCLELMDAADTTDDPGGRAELEQLESTWHGGVGVSRLDVEGLSIVLNGPEPLRVQRVGRRWRAAWLSSAASAETSAAAATEVARRVAAEARRLVETPTHALDADDVITKGQLLASVDLVASELGLWKARARWLLGRVEAQTFLPAQAKIEAVDLGELAPESSAGLFFARVPVSGDGTPSGGALELVRAGSGRSLSELFVALATLKSAS